MSIEAVTLECIEAARIQHSDGITALNERLNRTSLLAPLPVLEATHETLVIPEINHQRLEAISIAYRALRSRLEMPGAIDPTTAPMTEWESRQWAMNRDPLYDFAWANHFAWRLAIPLLSEPIRESEVS